MVVTSIYVKNGESVVDNLCRFIFELQNALWTSVNLRIFDSIFILGYLFEKKFIPKTVIYRNNISPIYNVVTLSGIDEMT